MLLSQRLTNVWFSTRKCLHPILTNWFFRVCGYCWLLSQLSWFAASCAVTVLGRATTTCPSRRNTLVKFLIQYWGLLVVAYVQYSRGSAKFCAKGWVAGNLILYPDLVVNLNFVVKFWDTEKCCRWWFQLLLILFMSLNLWRAFGIDNLFCRLAYKPNSLYFCWCFISANVLNYLYMYHSA